MDYKTGEKLFSVSSYLCIALVLASSILHIRLLSAVGLGVLALGAVGMLVFCKCPHICAFASAKPASARSVEKSCKRHRKNGMDL